MFSSTRSSKKKPEATSSINRYKPVTDYIAEAGLNGEFKKAINVQIEKLNEMENKQLAKNYIEKANQSSNPVPSFPPPSRQSICRRPKTSCY